MDIRRHILYHSLNFERDTSSFLSKLLDIENPEHTYSFGNRSSALSFSQKVYLLIDIGVLDKDKRDKFEKFMNVRNQFMHNVNADTYEKCVGYISGLEAWLLKKYPQDEALPLEKRLGAAIQKLCLDVMKETSEIIQRVIGKAAQKEIMKVRSKMLNLFIESLHEMRDILDENPELLNGSENIGSQVQTIICDIIDRRKADMENNEPPNVR